MLTIMLTIYLTGAAVAAWIQGAALVATARQAPETDWVTRLGIAIATVVTGIFWPSFVLALPCWIVQDEAERERLRMIVEEPLSLGDLMCELRLLPPEQRAQLLRELADGSTPERLRGLARSAREWADFVEVEHQRGIGAGVHDAQNVLLLRALASEIENLDGGGGERAGGVALEATVPGTAEARLAWLARQVETMRLPGADEYSSGLEGCPEIVLVEECRRLAGGTRSVKAEHLGRIRAAIDDVDAQLVELVGRRISLAVAAARVKRAAGLPLRDQVREVAVRDAARARALAQGIDPERAVAVVELVMESCREAQGCDLV